METCEVNVQTEANFENSQKVVDYDGLQTRQELKSSEIEVLPALTEQEPLKNLVNIAAQQLESTKLVEASQIGAVEENARKENSDENKENATLSPTENSLQEEEKLNEDAWSEVVLEPPADAQGSEGFQGFSVTPVGACTSYKGMTTSEILENSKSKKPEEPPKPRKKKTCNSKANSERARTSKQSCTGVNESADKGSFTRKLQQFLSGSINLFSPQGKGQRESKIAEDSEQNSELSVPSSSTNKSLNYEKSANENENTICTSNETNTLKTAETVKVAESMNSEHENASTLQRENDKIDIEESVVSIKKETSDINEETNATDAGTELEQSEINSNVKNKSTFTSLREMIRDIGSPRSTKYSISRRGQASNKVFNNFNYANATVKNSTKMATNSKNFNGKESNETVEIKNSIKLYSREKLLKLSENPACQSKPKITEVIEVSVAEDIDLGTEVPKKYSPVRILSREFKFKYRL